MGARTLLLAALFLFTAISALTYGVFAGRHNLQPAPMIVGLKTSLENALGLQRRWRRPFNDSPAGLAPVDCPHDPIVIVTGGQSNAANHLSDPVDAATDLDAFMFHDGACYRLVDPVLGATGDGGSLWTLYGQRLTDRLGRPVLMINTGVTSTTFDAWLDPRSGYFDRLERAVEGANRLGLSPHLVLWHQGESDAHRQGEADAFEPSIQALVERIQALPPMQDADFILFRASRCTGARANGNAPLVTAQTRVADRLPKVHVGPDTDQFGGRDRYDGCHFNARGRDQIVDLALELSVSILAPRLAQD